MSRVTMLDRAIAGRTVLGYADGMYAPMTRCSNLYRAIIACGYTPDDIGKTIDIAVGGRRGRTWRDGYHMAIVKI